MSDRSKANVRLEEFTGQTISSIRIHGGHGDVLTFIFEDGRHIDICTYHGTDKEKERHPSDVYVGINGKEIT